MQTSAKTKVKNFMFLNRKAFQGLPKERLKILTQDLEELLLIHERDTRYATIDVVNSVELLHLDDPFNSELNGLPVQLSVVDPESIVSKIHNLKVGEE
ncbi:putative coil containing protein [Vibrio phage 249E41-1]|nr:putative coil containing protein [Vibrio phage 249E41-1]